MTLHSGLLSTLVLLALLLCLGTDVHAAPDPIVEAIQRTLVERGYDPGAIDGAIGWRTRGALREFQRSVGLPATGRTDDATLAALGMKPRTGAEPKPEADTDTPQAEAPRAEPDTVPSTDTPQAETPRAEPDTMPSTDTPQAEAPRAEPAPVRTAGPRLSFATLGWHPPQTGAEALARFDAIGAPPEFKRGTGALFVPKGEFVFVLQAGERIPGLDCDPGAGRLSIEFVFGPDGPVIFTPVAGGEYCQTGIGIAIEVGRTLEIRRVDWGDMQYPQGTVRVTDRGLEYAR
jgi:hypothetical protein